MDGAPGHLRWGRRSLGARTSFVLSPYESEGASWRGQQQCWAWEELNCVE